MSTIRKSLSIGEEALTFLQVVARERELSLSAALTLVLQLVIRMDYQSLRSIAEDFQDRRQF